MAVWGVCQCVCVCSAKTSPGVADLALEETTAGPGRGEGSIGSSVSSVPSYPSLSHSNEATVAGWLLSCCSAPRGQPHLTPSQVIICRRASLTCAVDWSPATGVQR